MEDFNIDPKDVIFGREVESTKCSTDIFISENGYKTLTLKREEYCKIKGKECPITIPLVCSIVCDNFIRQKIPELMEKKD